MTINHIPRNNEVVRITNTKSASDIKPFVENALCDDGVKAEVEIHITNGGKSGHKLLDMAHAAAIIVKYDDKHGGNIRNKHLSEKHVIDQVLVVMRRNWIMDKQWKYVAPNPKRFIALAAPVEPTVEIVTE